MHSRLTLGCFEAAILVVFLSISIHPSIAQTTAVPWSRVSYLTARPHVKCDNGSIVVTSEIGGYVSHDSGNTYESMRDIDLLARFNPLNAIKGNGENVVLIQGAEFPHGYAGILRSADGGESWQAVPRDSLDGIQAYRISADQMVFYSPQCVRFGRMFSTNAGISWKHVPFPEGFSDGSGATVCMIEPGKFICRVATTNGAWYQADLESRTWIRRDDIPLEFEWIYYLQDSTCIARYRFEVYDAAIAVLLPGDTVWQRFPSVTDMHGVLHKRFDFNQKRTMLTNEYLIISDDSNRIMKTDGRSFTVVSTPAHMGFEGWDNERVLVTANGKCWLMRIDDLSLSPLPPMSLTSAVVLDKRVVGLNWQANQYSTSEGDSSWLQSGRLYRDSNTINPQPFESVGVCGERVCVVTGSHGLLTVTRADSRLKAIAQTFDDMDELTRVGQPPISALIGRGWMWEDGPNVMTGGEHLRRWTLSENGSATSRILMSDTIVTYRRNRDGSQYAAYRDLYRATDDTTWQRLAVKPVEDTTGGRGIISTVIKTSDGTLLLGRRGYDIVVNESSDTVRVTGGLVRSTNDGLTWQRVALPGNDNYVAAIELHAEGVLWATSTHATFIVHKDTAGVFIEGNFLQGEDHLLTSYDSGLTWVVAKSQKSFSKLSYSTRNLSSMNERLAVTFPDRVMVSTDYGTTWSDVLGLPATTINAARFDSLGNLWIACNEGLWVVRGDSTTSVADVDVSHGITFVCTQDGDVYHVNIDMQRDASTTEVMISDLIGHAVAFDRQNYGDNIQCAFQTVPGVYLITIRNNDQVFSKPILVQP